jgi:hypothetical protein
MGMPDLSKETNTRRNLATLIFLTMPEKIGKYKTTLWMMTLPGSVLRQ